MPVTLSSRPMYIVSYHHTTLRLCMWLCLVSFSALARDANARLPTPKNPLCVA